MATNGRHGDDQYIFWWPFSVCDDLALEGEDRTQSGSEIAVVCSKMLPSSLRSRIVPNINVRGAILKSEPYLGDALQLKSWGSGDRGARKRVT